jgi:hypothetical protein
MYIAHTVMGRYTLYPYSLVLYLEEEEEKLTCITFVKIWGDIISMFTYFTF